jgi:hypothetical protein
MESQQMMELLLAIREDMKAGPRTNDDRKTYQEMMARMDAPNRIGLLEYTDGKLCNK